MFLVLFLEEKEPKRLLTELAVDFINININFLKFFGVTFFTKKVTKRCSKGLLDTVRTCLNIMYS